jgi:glycosyltransferase involved in cell wall biosynthesis
MEDSRIPPGTARRLISINPDLQDGFGHYLHYDLRLRSAAQDLGLEFSTVANRASDPALLPGALLPTFTNNSWTAGRFRKPGVADAFADELKTAVDRIGSASGAGNSYFMYLGSIAHAAAVLQVAAATRSAANSFRINLFYSYDDFTPEGKVRAEVLDEYQLVLDAVDTVGGCLGVSLCVDTERMSELIRHHTGRVLPVLPFFSVTDLRESDARSIRERPLPARGGEFTVYFPGNMQLDKGYDLVLDLVERFSHEHREFPVRFVMRDMSVGKEIPGAARRLKKLGDRITLLQGVLSDEDYKAQFMRAHVILIPYRRSAFFARTSAVYSDATVLGIPVIAVRDTWMGANTERLGNGLVFDDRSPAEFSAALRHLLENYGAFVEGAGRAREAWLKSNNPYRVVEPLAAAGREAASLPDAQLKSYLRLFETAIAISAKRVLLANTVAKPAVSGNDAAARAIRAGLGKARRLLGRALQRIIQ